MLRQTKGFWMKTLICVCVLIALWSVPFAQNDSTGLDNEINELLKLHKQGREAHFRTNVDLLLSNHPEAGFISVSQGKISQVSKDQSRQRFAAYFKDAQYYEWDDLEPPIVRVSKDGTLAWMITRLKVRRTQKDSAGTVKEEKFVYAGIMTYEKKDGKWIRTANVSTFE